MCIGVHLHIEFIRYEYCIFFLYKCSIFSRLGRMTSREAGVGTQPMIDNGTVMNTACDR